MKFQPARRRATRPLSLLGPLTLVITGVACSSSGVPASAIHPEEAADAGASTASQLRAGKVAVDAAAFRAQFPYSDPARLPELDSDTAACGSDAFDPAMLTDTSLHIPLGAIATATTGLTDFTLERKVIAGDAGTKVAFRYLAFVGTKAVLAVCASDIASTPTANPAPAPPAGTSSPVPGSTNPPPPPQGNDKFVSYFNGRRTRMNIKLDSGRIDPSTYAPAPSSAEALFNFIDDGIDDFLTGTSAPCTLALRNAFVATTATSAGVCLGSGGTLCVAALGVAAYYAAKLLVNECSGEERMTKKPRLDGTTSTESPPENSNPDHRNFAAVTQKGDGCEEGRCYVDTECQYYLVEILGKDISIVSAGKGGYACPPAAKAWCYRGACARFYDRD